MSASNLQELLGHYAGDRGRANLLRAFEGQEWVKRHSEIAARLADVARLTAWAPGAQIFAENAPGRGRLFFLLYGAMSLTVNHRVLKTMEAGEAAGEFPVLNPNVPHTVTLRANTPSIVAEVLGEDFIAIAKVFPALWENMAATLAMRLRMTSPRPRAWRVFVGHGRNPSWQHVTRYLSDVLNLDVDTYEATSRAGLSVVEFLKDMLDRATFAVIVFTAEDAMADGGRRARQNVLHEAGLFQGRLGFDRVVLLEEEGVEEFSNVHGLQRIRFRSGFIEEAYPELRRALEREGHVNIAAAPP